MSNKVQKWLEQLLSSKIESVEAGNDEIIFSFAGNEQLKLNLEGDCCSSSFFVETPDLQNLVGENLLSLEEVSSSLDEATQLLEAEEREKLCKYSDSLLYYGLLIRTDKQSTTLEWRNSSNGYYSGSLGFSFRNNIKGKWERIY